MSKQRNRDAAPPGSAPRRVFMVNSMAMGGAERVISVLASEYVRRGDQVVLVCLEEGKAYDLPGDVEVVLLGKAARAAALQGANAILLAIRLKRLVTVRGWTCVLSFLHRADYVNVLSRLLGARHTAVLALRGNPGRYRAEGAKGKANLAAMKLLYPRADGYVYQTYAMYREYGSFVDRRKPFSVIPNPVNTEALHRWSNDGPWEALPARFLVMLGRLEKVKRCDLAITAVAEARNRIGASHVPPLLLVGEGAEREKLEEMTRALRLGELVRFLGARRNPFPLLGKAEALLLASDSEGFPNSVLEALSLGVPVIATDCISGPRELLEGEGMIAENGFIRGSCGLLVRPGDAIGLANALSRLLGDPLLRAELSARAAKRAANFAPDPVTRALDQFLAASAEART